MAIKSQYAAKCKDCGTKYDVGDLIEVNGNASPNKMGEMKDHWCKYGKNCQGVMQLQGSPQMHQRPSSQSSTGNDVPVSKDPTSREFLELGIQLLIDDEDVRTKTIDTLTMEVKQKMAEYLIKRSVIETAMDKLGLQHPGRRAFIEDVLK